MQVVKRVGFDKEAVSFSSFPPSSCLSLPNSKYWGNQILQKGKPQSSNSNQIFSNCILLPSFPAKPSHSSLEGSGPLGPLHRSFPDFEDANTPLEFLPPLPDACP